MPILPENNTTGRAVVPRHLNGMTKGGFLFCFNRRDTENLIANVFDVYYMYCKKEPYKGPRSN